MPATWPTSRRSLRDPRYRFVQGDICDGGLLDELLPGHDAVVNFAAETHVDRSIVGRSRLRRHQRARHPDPVRRLPATRIPRVVHVGTDEVYGSIDEGSWTEDGAAAPELAVLAPPRPAPTCSRAPTHETYGLDISTTRCSNNYGPYQFPEKVIPLFVTNLIDGQKVPLYGDGLNVRDWLHVDDHCRGIELVLEKGEPGESYNIGGGAS